MKVRDKPRRPGARAWAKDCGSYPLPPGLAHGTLLTIIRWEQFVGVVRDEQGREWELVMPQVDPGSEYLSRNGRWLPEEHPLVQAALPRHIEEYEAMKPGKDLAVVEVYNDVIRHLREVIARHQPGQGQSVPDAASQP